ncbi:MAG: CcmD family protein [Lentimicrobium sp.]|jgi:CcmD family protein|nr:CcmD family protein [Lentimicrobium sp.]MDD2528645.1 CcmD family protein [Lentimicrobiaceae bacterium]MDD4596788.1 CcmD family protein [Lentimicrobiaceae bacterium]MDY0027119.1 CcmD family protein [Lentimicrobium sp.]HAH59120.1 hypothetical protein [Bacteroidales bacterium]
MITGDLLIIVVAVMAIIFTGLGIYLFSIDRKLTRLEKKQELNNMFNAEQ